MPSLRVRWRTKRPASALVYCEGLRSSANSAGFCHAGWPSARQQIDSAQRGNCSPGYHLPWPKCRKPPWPYSARSLCTSSVAKPRLVGPRASVFHSGASRSPTATKVGSAPIVRRTLPATRSAPAPPPPPERPAPPPPPRQRAPPLVFGVGLGHGGRFKDARHAHLVAELHLGLVHAAFNRRGARGLGCASERDVALARHQAAGGIQADPACAGQVDLAPGVQVGSAW